MIDKMGVKEFRATSIEATRRGSLPSLLEIIPLDSAPNFSWRQSEARLGPLGFFDITCNCEVRMTFQGKRPGYEVHLPVTGAIEGTHRGEAFTLTPGTAGIFLPEGEKVFTRYRAGTRMIMAQVDQQAADSALRRQVSNFSSPQIDFSFNVDLTREPASTWARMLLFLHSLTVTRHHLLATSAASDSLGHGMLNSLLLASSHPYRSELEEPQKPAASGITATAVGHLQRNPRAPWDMPRIARECNASTRAVHYAFRKDLGISPMAYLKSIRLNGARAELLAASPEDATVKSIASYWGFQHPSHFAGSYYRAFNEHPRETLRRQG